MPKSRNVMIGVDPFTVTCPAPRERIGSFEAIALTLRGWMDAARNRDVADIDHTHTLWWLQSRHQQAETEVVRRVNAGLSRIDAAAAELDAKLAEPEPLPAEPPSREELRDAGAAARAAWAARARAARSDSRRAARLAEEKAHARVQRERLLSHRESLEVEGQDVRHRWAKAYEMRAARYTRARFVRWGRGLAEQPAVAEYAPAVSPRAVRRAEREA